LDGHDLLRIELLTACHGRPLEFLLFA